MKGWKKYSKQIGINKKASIGISISDKIDFKRKVIKRDKEGQLIILKGIIY